MNERKGVCIYVCGGEAGLKQEANGGHVRGHSNVLLSNVIPSKSMHTHTPCYHRVSLKPLFIWVSASALTSSFQVTLKCVLVQTNRDSGSQNRLLALRAGAQSGV